MDLGLHVPVRHALERRHLGIREGEEEARGGEPEFNLGEVLPDAHWAASVSRVPDHRQLKQRGEEQVSPREPRPNGMYESFMAFVGSAHRDGMKASGCGNTTGSRCIL